MTWRFTKQMRILKSMLMTYRSKKIVPAIRQPGAGKNPAIRSFLWSGAISLLLLAASPASAEGFRNPPPGAFDLGRAGGRIAQVDDSSAVAQNPANLVDVARTEFQFTPSVVYIRAEFTSPGGETASTVEPWKFLPNLFFATPLADGKYALGVGLTPPYGIRS